MIILWIIFFLNFKTQPGVECKILENQYIKMPYMEVSQVQLVKWPLKVIAKKIFPILRSFCPDKFKLAGSVVCDIENIEFP